MDDANVDSLKLYCIVEKQLFYYGILSGDKLIRSEQIQINKDFNFFDSPEVIKEFLARNLHNLKIEASYFCIASPNYALVPNNIEQNEIQFWLDGENDDSNQIIINRFNEMQIAFSLPKQWISDVSTLFSKFELHHILETNLQHNLPKNGVLSYKIDGFQLVGLFEDGELKYQNLFSSTRDLSQLYYSLLPYYTLKQDLLKTPLFTVKPTEVFYNRVSKYVANVEFLQHELELVSRTELNLAQLYQIQQLYTCVS